ncbi:MAG: hypothetical protein AMXMBFR4_33020 [Candidatus Hydrogenedentota bacterium]
MSQGKEEKSTSARGGWIRFDRNEWAGSFGDLGTDLPLIAAMIPAASLDAASVFVLFGAAQLLTGFLYGLPMPMQPLKAMAVLVITQKLSAGVLHGAGLAIGCVMLVLTLSGLLNWLARVIPLCVIRGVQMGLGLQLANLAMKSYLPGDGAPGYVLALVSFAIGVALMGSRRFPAALAIIALGMVYAMVMDIDVGVVAGGIGLAAPVLHVPTWADLATGFIALTLPQLPLSLSNSVFATDRTLRDLFPDRHVGLRKIGLTYSVVNMVVPFFGGIPMCHGCGGLAGHYAFGARTGGSVVIYGSMFVVIGLLFGKVADHVVRIFPQPVLGVILLFEALTLLLFVRDTAHDRRGFMIALLVAVAALSLPQGFIIGLLGGTLLYYLPERFSLGR